MVSDITDKTYKAIYERLNGNVRLTDGGVALPVHVNFVGYLTDNEAYINVGSMALRNESAKNTSYVRLSFTVDVVVNETAGDYTSLTHAVNDVIRSIGHEFVIDEQTNAYIVDCMDVKDLTEIENGVFFRKVIRYEIVA